VNSASARTAEDCQRSWRQFPESGLNDIIGVGNCLILAPHPDDESLGCGGLIAACVAAGRPPLVAILTDGAGSHPNSQAFPPDRLRERRAREVRAAVGILGLAPGRLIFLNQPDRAAPLGGPGFEAASRTLLAQIRQERACTAILAPWRHDPHCDHKAASLLASAVASSAAIRHIAYPVWGWTLPPDTPLPQTATAGFRLNIGAFLPAKRAAIMAHQSQYGDLITDDPAGFRFPPELLSAFDTPFETFILP
jgi:LmbE family N-acetylglucosaminyl deacetylase